MCFFPPEGAVCFFPPEGAVCFFPPEGSSLSTRGSLQFMALGEMKAQHNWKSHPTNVSTSFSKLSS